MNCTHVRERLLAWQYGELSPSEQAEVDKHLAGCAACREELTAWHGVRRRLEAFKAPAVEVDLRRVYQRAALGHEHRFRRWRRTALAVIGVAAAVLIAVGLNLKIRVDASQLIVQWGGSPKTQAEMQEPTPAPHAVQSQPPAQQVTAEDLQLVKDLIRVLAKEVQTRDRRQQEALLRLQARFEAFMSRANDRLVSGQRDLTALYTAYLGVRRKGEKP
jgi:anti-sigma factor RsiW